MDVGVDGAAARHHLLLPAVRAGACRRGRSLGIKPRTLGIKPPLGTISSFLLCVQFAREKRLEIGIKPFTQRIIERQGKKLAHAYPQYDFHVLSSYRSAAHTPCPDARCASSAHCPLTGWHCVRYTCLVWQVEEPADKRALPMALLERAKADIPRIEQLERDHPRMARLFQKGLLPYAAQWLEPSTRRSAAADPVFAPRCGHLLGRC